jgi:hypothetical protein
MARSVAPEKILYWRTVCKIYHFIKLIDFTNDYWPAIFVPSWKSPAGQTEAMSEFFLFVA